MTDRQESSPASELAESILLRYRQVFRASREGEPLLRHGRRTVAVSTIAQQFYCEKAVQYSIEMPRGPTAQMLSGIAGHEAAASQAIAMTQEQAIAEAVAAREQPICVYEFRIGWRHGDVTVLGFVDEAWFREGNVDLVVERKFSSSPAIHTPYHVQASLYCLGLGEMGFGTEHARYRISVFSRRCHNCEQLEGGTCPGTAAEAQSYECEKGSCATREYPFDRDGTICDLNWALAYWTFDREAEPTTHAERCRYCRYRQVCDSYQG